MVSLAESCTMKIRPDVQQYKSGRTAIQLGLDCDSSAGQKIFGCEYGDLITSWTPCKSIEGWSDLFNQRDLHVESLVAWLAKSLIFFASTGFFVSLASSLS